MAQWTTYDCSLNPIAAGFSEGDKDRGDHFNVEVIDDPDISGNKLLIYDQPDDDSKTSYRMAWTATQATIALRVKGLDGSSSDKIAEIDIRNGSTGVKLQVYYDDTVRFDDDAIDVFHPTTNVDEWHLYRVTMNGDDFAAYMDEDETPILSGTSVNLRSEQRFQFGDASGGTAISGVFDWIIWDESGAYAPGEGTAIPPELCTDFYVGIDDPVVEGFFFYPNPAKNFVNIKTPHPITSGTLVIYNMLGAKVLENNITKQLTRMDISSLKQGVYFIQLNVNNKRFTQSLIVK